MLNFVDKNGKKVMEMKDNGETTVFDAKLAGLGELKEEDKDKGAKKDGESE